MPVYYRGMPYVSSNPLVRALAVVAGLGMFMLMVFLGVVFLAAFAALGLITWVAFQVRRWWLSRQGNTRGHEPGVVDAEYRVVERRETHSREDR